jgi:hypothetical protein
MDFKETKNVTGDHAENINAITRSQQRNILLASLPKKTQEILNFNVRKFDGRDSQEAGKWLKDIEEWLSLNDLPLVSAFDLLLSEEAGELWKDSKTDEMTQVEAREWFRDTFMMKKSILDNFMELANVKQEPKERFATFEIRVKKLINSVLDSELSREQILNEFLTKRVRSTGLRDSLALKPEMKREDMRTLAKVYENREISEDEKMEVSAFNNKTNIKQKNPQNYAQAVKYQPTKQFQQSNFGPRRSTDERFIDRDFSNRISPTQSAISEFRQTPVRQQPSVSLKHIA